MSWLEGLAEPDWRECYSDSEVQETARQALDLIDELLKEKKGEWKNGHCSCCGEDVSSVLDTWTNVQNFLFCPYCGANMESR